ncbi:hypothetical protein MRX96_017791 [Rhipicephalus microplus]
MTPPTPMAAVQAQQPLTELQEMRKEISRPCRNSISFARKQEGENDSRAQHAVIAKAARAYLLVSSGVRNKCT